MRKGIIDCHTKRKIGGTAIVFTIHIQNMNIFDNSGIFGNALTIPADSISAVNAGIMLMLSISRKWLNCRDCRRFARIVESFHILANTRFYC